MNKSERFLVIVESPHKAKTITSILQTAGYTKAIVMASVGHISNLKANRKSYKNTGIYPNEDFRMDFALADDKKPVVNSLLEQVKRCTKVYLMTDGDREGEAIAWALIKFLKLKSEQYYRCITHEITPKAVLHALDNPTVLSDNIVESAHTRQGIDIIIGYVLSPILKLFVGGKSAGRVQSIALLLVVDREREIENFIPEKYFDLYLDFNKNGTDFRAKYICSDKIKDNYTIRKIKAECKDDFIISDITKKEHQESPKAPFTTSSFQQEAAGKFGISVKGAMDIAQYLFDNGKITYHRTDSQEYAAEFLPELENYIKTNYGKYVVPRKGKQKNKVQDGHEALRVTDLNLTPELAKAELNNELRAKVYELIWRRTVASGMPNAVISETIYNIYNNGHNFTFSSNELIDKGYREVYTYADTKLNAVDETFNKDEKLENTNLVDVEKITTPPSRYTEAALVKKLDDEGIGRPATFAVAVEKVLDPSRSYSNLNEEKKIVPTERGRQVSDFLQRVVPDIINYDYTRKMEEDLDKVAAGELTRQELLQALIEKLETDIEKNTVGIPKPETEITCPKCGGPMQLRRNRFGKLFYGCKNYPKCTGIVNKD